MVINTNNKITREEANVLLTFAKEITDRGMSDIRCPRCGQPLKILERGNSFTVFCEDDDEVKISGRGI